MKKIALALVVISAVLLIGQAVLNTRRSTVVPDGNQPKALSQLAESVPAEPAPAQAAPEQDAASTPQETAIVDKRGKEKIKPEELIYMESAGRGIEQTRMSRDGESESERERERKK